MLERSKFSFACFLAFATVLFASCNGRAAAVVRDRVALVLGNSAYQAVTPLKNARNDAEAVAESLKRLGFDVVERLDTTQTGLREALVDFAPKARAAKMVFVYYAGHGIQIDDENYIVPIDVKITSEDGIKLNAITVRQLRSALGPPRRDRTVVLVLDACRNNPFLDTRGASRGLAREAISEGTLIVLSAKAGQVAPDGEGLHSPFAEALLRHIGTRGLDVVEMFRRVAGTVEAQGEAAPTPDLSFDGSLRVSLAPLDLDVEEADFNKARDIGTAEALAEFIRRHPNAATRPDVERRLAEIEQEKAWKAALASRDPGTIEKYLRQFPATPHRVVAQNEVITLRIERQRKQEEDERSRARTDRDNIETSTEAQQVRTCELSFAAAPVINSAAVATLPLQSTCGPIPVASISYGRWSLERIPAQDVVELDLFAGAEKITISDKRGGSVDWTPPASAFKGIAKAVVAWSVPVALDLEVQEFSAPLGVNGGHLTSENRGRLADAQEGGRGFISSTDDGQRGRDHVDVYTFFQNRHSPRGEVAFGVKVSNSERGLTCASNRNDRYETFLLVNGSLRAGNRSLVSRLPCLVAQRSSEPLGSRLLRGFQTALSTPF